MIGLREFSAAGDGATDDTAAFNAAIEVALARGESLRIPAGRFCVAETLTPKLRAAACGRYGGLSLVGEGIFQSVIEFAGTGYCLDFAAKNAYADALTFRDFSIKTATGGGIKLGEGSPVTFDGFFMDGCAAGYWGIYGDGPYHMDISRSRFWNNGHDYKGGAIYQEDGHTFALRNVFVSKVEKDGDVVYLKNIKNVSVESLALESYPVNGAAGFAAQSMLVFDGYCSSVDIANIYGEGIWNTLVEFRLNGSNRNARVRSIYGWQKNTGGYGDPDCLLLKAGNAANYPMNVERLHFKSDISAAPSGDGYLVEDPNVVVTVDAYTIEASAGQASRPLKYSS